MSDSLKFEIVIARAERVMRQLDERDGPARAAARRERQRLNADLGKRLARVGVAVGVISILTIVVGLFVPIGMFGFLAAVGIAIGVAALLGFLPDRTGASAPAADLPNGEMVQKFDSYLHRRRAMLPAPARTEVDRIGALLPSLRQSLERLDAVDPRAQDARRLMALHLPGLVDRYANVPSAFHDQRDGEGLSVDERLTEGLAAGREALSELCDTLARSQVAELETHGRFLKSRYGPDRIES